MKIYRRFDFVVIIILLAIASAYLLLLRGSGENLTLEIYRHNRLVREIPLLPTLKEQVLEWDDVKIKIFEAGSGAAFIHSDCHDQICVHSGKIHTNGQQVACVPNGILLKIVEKNDGKAIGKTPQKLTASFTGSFNTVSNLLAYDISREEFQTITADFGKKLERLHRLFNIYDEMDVGFQSEQPTKQKNLRGINESESGILLIDKDLGDLLLYAKDAHRISGGKVNICLGELLRIWHHARERRIPPSESTLLRTLQSRIPANDFDYEILPNPNDPQSCFLHLHHTLTLDVGAIAKGFALDLLAKDIELSYPNGNFLISLGGNIKGVGTKKDWTVGIQHPDRNEVFASFALPREKAVATSGDYERYFDFESRRYHHIIDPETLYPANFGIRSVTVLAENGALADVLTTALFLMPPKDGLKLAEANKAEVFYILEDLSIITSDGFPKFQRHQP